MAKPSAPGLSLDMTGTIGGVMTFSKWKGRPVLKRKPHPSNPRTGGQVGMRSMFKWATQEWAQLPTNIQASWQTVADQTQVLGINSFTSVAQKRTRDGLAPYYQPDGTGDGTPDAPADVADSVTGRNAEVTWTDPTTPDPFGIMIHVSDTTLFTPAFENLVAVVDAGVQAVTLGPFAPGTYYYRVRAFGQDGTIGTAAAEGSFTIS